MGVFLKSSMARYGSVPAWSDFFRIRSGCLHPRLGLAIGFAISRATGKVLKIPFFGEFSEFVSCKLRSIVANHLIRYAIPGKVALEL